MAEITLDEDRCDVLARVAGEVSSWAAVMERELLHDDDFRRVAPAMCRRLQELADIVTDTVDADVTTDKLRELLKHGSTEKPVQGGREVRNG